jgi:hypothetical protein
MTFEMMKTISLLFIIMTLFGNRSSIAQKEPKKETNCFSKENFELVYQYINNQIKSNNINLYTIDEYKVSLEENPKRIRLKRNEYTVALIYEKGIYSLNKSKKGNERGVIEANQVFCKLYQLCKETK